MEYLLGQVGLCVMIETIGIIPKEFPVQHSKVFVGVVFLVIIIAPVELFSGNNVFSKSPTDLALERSEARTREILREAQRSVYFRGSILDYELLSGYTRVPRNIIEAAAEISRLEGGQRNDFVISFSEALGQLLAEGKPVPDAVYAVFQDSPDFAELLLQTALAVADSRGRSTTLISDGNGHFWGKVRINAIDVTMLVDTGATNVILTPEDAEASGINLNSLDFDIPISTAAGEQNFARTSIGMVEVFGRVFNDVEVFVSPLRDPRGVSLLGMSVLKYFSSISIVGGQMVIDR